MTGLDLPAMVEQARQTYENARHGHVDETRALADLDDSIEQLRQVRDELARLAQGKD